MRLTVPRISAQVFLLTLPILSVLSFPASAAGLKWKAATSISYKFFVEAALNGQPESFFLDTGSYDSMVKSDSKTIALPSQGKTVSFSSADRPQTCDVVSITELSLDRLTLHNDNVERCNLGAYSQNVLGIDAFNEQIFTLKFSTGILSITHQPLKNAAPLRRSKANQIELPVEIAGVQTAGLFDTGWGITAVDSQFIAAHPESFTLSSRFSTNQTATDMFGNTLKVTYYRVNDLKIGNLDFGGQIVQSYTFVSDVRNVLGNDTSVIIGTNTMINADWGFDLTRNLWAASMRSR